MISVLNIFSVSVGPSSSHTAGPMRAAHYFLNALKERDLLNQVARVSIDLYGSLALTGKGHCTDQAIFLGLEGNLPENITSSKVMLNTTARIISSKQLLLAGAFPVSFVIEQDINWLGQKTLARHTNALRLVSYDRQGGILHEQVYYSVGGGFVECDENLVGEITQRALPYEFNSAKELWALCTKHNLSLKDLMLANEDSWRPRAATCEELHKISKIMDECIASGCSTEGYLPGRLKLKRRAAAIYQRIAERKKQLPEHLAIMDLVNAYALAVAEENASGSRVISAPTNGAAGVIPAVLRYYREFCAKQYGAEDEVTFLLTAGAIALLYKNKASISGAEVGCQGEIGVAASMAAGALAAVLGGSNQKIDKAAEIAMEHSLGLTCDPVAGLVQIPCIERNAAAAIRAIHAAMLALSEDGNGRVSLDEIIVTMMKTGQDMCCRYKETSLAGLAVNLASC